ncbi:MAG: guanylate kinase, partial [Cryptosporangiaceae bacterium]|nr:guanylate kinase [Cryptosporangiaceae bacterium]
MQGIILYGPPASGKDTITGALHALDSRYVLFPRIKCGPGKASGYRMVSATELSELRAHGEILWENERYGSVYAVDRSGLREHLAAHTPVLHLGQPDAVEAVREEFFEVDWTVADLSCQLETAKTRLSKRGDVKLEDRLRT